MSHIRPILRWESPLQKQSVTLQSGIKNSYFGLKWIVLCIHTSHIVVALPISSGHGGYQYFPPCSCSLFPTNMYPLAILMSFVDALIKSLWLWRHLNGGKWMVWNKLTFFTLKLVLKVALGRKVSKYFILLLKHSHPAFSKYIYGDFSLQKSFALFNQLIFSITRYINAGICIQIYDM